MSDVKNVNLEKNCSQVQFKISKPRLEARTHNLSIQMGVSISNKSFYVLSNTVQNYFGNIYTYTYIYNYRS